MRKVHIVIKAVLHRRTRSKLRFRPDFQNGRRNYVSCGMSQPLDIGHLRALLQSFAFLRHWIQRLTRSSPDSLAATLAAQPSMSLAPLAPFLDFARNDKGN